MNSNNKKIIIALDGHSSCGKSTTAKQVANALAYIYIDTGAMYRAVTLFALRNKLINNKEVATPELISKLESINISFKTTANSNKCETMLNGESVEEEIRLLEVSENVSAIASIKEVRELLVAKQQEMGIAKGIVMDGRDIGTVVFPTAELKIFMTASPEIRAQRRYDELIAKGENVSYDDILKNVTERDYIDSTRAESPLRQAEDALLLDNSKLTIDQQVNWIIEKANSIINS